MIDWGVLIEDSVNWGQGLKLDGLQKKESKHSDEHLDKQRTVRGLSQIIWFFVILPLLLTTITWFKVEHECSALKQKVTKMHQILRDSVKVSMNASCNS